MKEIKKTKTVSTGPAAGIISALVFVFFVLPVSVIKTKMFLIGVSCVVAITMPVIAVISLHPQKDHVYDNIAPLSSGEYSVQGIAEFPGETVDSYVEESITVDVDYSLTDHGLVKIDVTCPEGDVFYVSLLQTDGGGGAAGGGDGGSGGAAGEAGDDGSVGATVEAGAAEAAGDGHYDKKLKPYGSTGVFSLTHGPGEYELCVWLKKSKIDESHSNYRLVYRNCFAADFPELAPYSYSNANSAFEEDSVVAAYANALIKDARDDMEKAQIIIAFVHERISYDGEIPLDTEVFLTADEILTTEKGLCYHSAGLTVAMLKSVGIPAKEVRGTYRLLNGRHAWCEVYIDGVWRTGDPTCYGAFPLSSILYKPDEFANPHN